MRPLGGVRSTSGRIEHPLRVQVLQVESLRVVVNLPQQVAAKVREHREAHVLTEEGRVAADKITIFPFADSASNTFTVRVNLPDGQYQLYPGMFAKVPFVIGDAERLGDVALPLNCAHAQRMASNVIGPFG